MSGSEDVMAERAVTAQAGVVAAAFAVVQSPLCRWEEKPEKRWVVVDLGPFGRTLEETAIASAFYTSAAVTNALNTLLDTSAQFLSAVKKIQDNSRAFTSGMLNHELRPQYAELVTSFEAALTDYVIAARRDLGLDGEWRPVRRAIDRHRTEVRR